MNVLIKFCFPFICCVRVGLYCRAIQVGLLSKIGYSYSQQLPCDRKKIITLFHSIDKFFYFLVKKSPKTILCMIQSGWFHYLNCANRTRILSVEYNVSDPTLSVTFAPIYDVPTARVYHVINLRLLTIVNNGYKLMLSYISNLILNNIV